MGAHQLGTPGTIPAETFIAAARAPVPAGQLARVTGYCSLKRCLSVTCGPAQGGPRPGRERPPPPPTSLARPGLLPRRAYRIKDARRLLNGSLSSCMESGKLVTDTPQMPAHDCALARLVTPTATCEDFVVHAPDAPHTPGEKTRFLIPGFGTDGVPGSLLVIQGSAWWSVHGFDLADGIRFCDGVMVTLASQILDLSASPLPARPLID